MGVDLRITKSWGEDGVLLFGYGTARQVAADIAELRCMVPLGRLLFALRERRGDRMATRFAVYRQAGGLSTWRWAEGGGISIRTNTSIGGALRQCALATGVVPPEDDVALEALARLLLGLL